MISSRVPPRLLSRGGGAGLGGVQGDQTLSRLQLVAGADVDLANGGGDGSVGREVFYRPGDAVGGDGVHQRLTNGARGADGHALAAGAEGGEEQYERGTADEQRQQTVTAEPVHQVEHTVSSFKFRVSGKSEAFNAENAESAEGWKVNEPQRHRDTETRRGNPSQMLVTPRAPRKPRKLTRIGLSIAGFRALSLDSG
jgi:hypothetical protein